MRKRLLLTGYITILCSGIMWAQQGVLRPETQGHTHVHADGSVCNGDHDHDADETNVTGQSNTPLMLAVPQNQPPEGIGTTDVSPRRGSNQPGHRDIIGSENNVYGTFGAGESSVVSAKEVVWPATGHHLPGSLLVGSDYSKNAVVGIYDYDGLAAGAVKGIRLYGPNYNGPDPVKYTPTNSATYNYSPAATVTVSAADTMTGIHSAAQYKITGGAGIVTGVSSSSITGTAVHSLPNGYGGVLKPYFDAATDRYYVPIWNHVSMNQSGKWDAEVVTQNKFYFDIVTADTLYTSTRDKIGQKDDGQSLLYKISGSPGVYNDFAGKVSETNYVRPTTILLSGTNNLSAITIGDVEWYVAFLTSTPNGQDTVGPFKAYNPGTCGHLSGYAAYVRDKVKFDTIKPTLPGSFSGKEGTYPSNRYVDAAVRLLDEADVSVAGDVLDNTIITNSKYSLNTDPGVLTKTDAILVLPGANGFKGRSNFRLKIGGNAEILHTQDSGAYNPTGRNPLEDGYLYRHSQGSAGPGDPFPVAQVPIWLSGGNNSGNYYDEVSGLKEYDHPLETRTLTSLDNLVNPKDRMPYSRTYASVYGVNGLYNGGIDIHTRTIDGNDTTSVIEIGSATTTNQDKFRIYSKGMLKNFRMLPSNNGDRQLTVGGMDNKAPEFNLSNTEPLYIINDGTGVESPAVSAGITFTAAGVQSINTAITNATGAGDLHIQANRNIRFEDHDVEFKLTQDNEIKALSDYGHIFVEGNFLFKNNPDAHLTLWARGDCNNGLNHDGYVTLDKSATVISASADPAKGAVLIKSENDQVNLNGGLAYTGIDGLLWIDGNKSVNIKNAHDGYNLSLSGITLNNNEGLYIRRTGMGSDSISSDGGHVMVENPLTFVQSGTAGNTGNGLGIWAKGDHDASLCSTPVHGYVWLQNDVNTTNRAAGTVSILSNRHYVRIGAAEGTGHVTHHGENGHLSILAQGPIYGACTENDVNEQPDAPLLKTRSAHPRRGYLWAGDDVNITFEDATGTTPEGNAVLRSYNDIVQLDDSVTFADTRGANLWVDGKWGVRTLGPTSLTNTRNSAGTGTAPGVQSNYETARQGYVSYLSQNGYVDFGISPTAGNDSPLTGQNTPFSYTALDPANALLVEGNSRVFFGDSVTITMDAAAPAPAGADARIYSPEGWIAFADTTAYKGRDGNFIVYAAGNANNRRSEWLFKGTCDLIKEGFVLFDSITDINYKSNGIAWIRSVNDDVIIGDMFTYNNENNAASRTDNGELVIQAGQDIYGRNAGQGFTDLIRITQPGEKSILLEARKTIHLEQNLLVDRKDATNGDITLKAGYPTFSEPSTGMSSKAADGGNSIPSADLLPSLWLTKGTVSSTNYVDRFAAADTRSGGGGSTDGGDIWFEGRVLFDLTKPANGSSNIQTTLRAFNSIFIDSTFVYQQNVNTGGNILLFAETGNVEATVTRQDIAVTGYMADDTVKFDIQDASFDKEIRIQAGNQVWNEVSGNENAAPTHIGSWQKGGGANAEYFGNILFNKPFVMQNEGTGNTILSAARDIESQVMAPFVFTYNSANSGKLDITAGRHVETHALWQFNYLPTGTAADITVEAGRLKEETLTANSRLCKTAEEGTTLTIDGEKAFSPEVATGNSSKKNNAFAEGGQGNGSILAFDSIEFNYNGSGRILLVAENGNIESDPYLHKNPLRASNPGNQGAGYSSLAPLQHDAQITFNHGGTGVTQLKAIDIKLHDKIAYYATQTADRLKNGQFYMTAYDSILTRNLQYVNPTDTGSVFITAAKYKQTSSAGCDDVISHGHIVLGYGADGDGSNINDSILFDYRNNPSTQGANVNILAGYEGYDRNTVTGKGRPSFTDPRDARKGWGGNITWDYMEIYMSVGNGDAGGSTKIMTPNGNIWGKDSLKYRGINGNLLIDAGLGSEDDAVHAVAAALLNTQAPANCENDLTWRTGNIIMKGANVKFAKNGVIGTGSASFRTREGFIDVYDAFTLDSMKTFLLKYAGMDDATKAKANNWGDLSERDFAFTAPSEGVDIFFGADDNIMLNYGNSSSMYDNGYGILGSQTPGFPGHYNPASYTVAPNPYYRTSYEGYIDDLYASTYSVGKDGYLYYRSPGYSPRRKSHLLYRGCDVPGAARDLLVDFRSGGSARGGFAAVASNYIDLFTNFTYWGGTGSGMGTVPGRGSLHGENVAGYGLYIKSQFNSAGTNYPEKRRATCEGCGATSSWPTGDASSTAIPEMTYIGFHNDARIHTNNQKSLLEAPVIEFFGHAELDSETGKGSKTKLTLKGDSLIFHDSVIFDGRSVELLPFTTDATQRANDMRYGVINDRGQRTENYSFYGPAIEMTDRNLPVIELGYQRCSEPGVTLHSAPNARSGVGLERTPTVGGDVIVAFKHGFSLPIFNSVVANNARISFISDSLDGVPGGEYLDAFIRTDLLRIRNKVEFYTDPSQPKNRKGKFVLATPSQMDDKMVDPGMYMRHLHTEPGSELSIPGEDSLIVIATTVVGGYGNIHENVFVKANGILAPGYASLMEHDCQTPKGQGTLTVHNLQMEKDAVLRISAGAQSRKIMHNGQEIETLTDVINVEDTVLLTEGKVTVKVLTEMKTLPPGRYLFITYGDKSGLSQEYVKNFVLETQRYDDTYFALDFSDEGDVYLKVSGVSEPSISYYVDLPAIEGVTTVPEPRRHFVTSYKHFSFTAMFTGAPLKITATGFYSARTVDLDNTAKALGDNTFEYTIYQVIEPWTIFIGPDASTAKGVSNEFTNNARVWTYRNTLYINAEREDVVSIYNMTGVLSRKIDVPEGVSKFTLEKGIYVVTLKDGSVHRVIVK